MGAISMIGTQIFRLTGMYTGKIPSDEELEEAYQILLTIIHSCNEASHDEQDSMCRMYIDFALPMLLEIMPLMSHDQQYQQLISDESVYASMFSSYERATHGVQVRKGGRGAGRGGEKRSVHFHGRLMRRPFSNCLFSTVHASLNRLSSAWISHKSRPVLRFSR